MAYKEWNEEILDGDCILPYSWNDMVEYIQHSSSCTFTIYDDELSTNQKFKFSYSGDDSIIAGANITGYDLLLKTNTIDAYPFIELLGNAGLNLIVADYNPVIFKTQTVQGFKFLYIGNQSLIEGGEITGDDFYIKANSTDTYPHIKLWGNDNIELASKNDIYFYEETTQMFKFSLVTNDAIIEGLSATEKNLKLKSNVNDAYPYIYLDGNDGMDLRMNTADKIDFYETTTKFFSIDGNAADKHFDFFLHDAHQFVIENRDSDPTSGVLVSGRIWFRTDL